MHGVYCSWRLSIP